MAKRNRWNIFVGISVLILLGIILEEAITSNKITAPISKLEQEGAIKIAEQFLQSDLSQVQEYKVFVGKTGKYFYFEGGRKKIIEVTFSYGDKSITALVDIDADTVIQVSRTENYDWA